MDRLQQLFKQRDAWSFKELRAATEQPAEYLKEILQMIAVSPRSGPNTNMWLLNATQKANLEMERGLNAVEEPGPSAVKTEGGVKAEDAGEEAVDDDEDEDEDDEEEFEEV
ncbi:hypothetical protein FRB99_002741 [Tulasnella sp. 403]|nr:hypothetical protein FRB99_002741 [Tulasnella sp. 403]